MTYPLYNLALTCAAPFGAAWLALSSRRRPLLARFAPALPVLDGQPIWIHACSVGETNTARPVIAAIQKKWPSSPIVLTVSTVTGYAHAQSALPLVHVAWCPFDSLHVVRSFLKRLQPRALLLMETEIWPNLVRECRRRHIPVALVNGRISDKHFPRYARWRNWLYPVMQQISAACVQNVEYGDRLKLLGMDTNAVYVTGNTKFDGLSTLPDRDQPERLRQEMGIGVDDLVVVFGSLRAGDDALAARCWRQLRNDFPKLRLIMAPRHLDRLQSTLELFDEPVLMRSKAVSGGETSSSERVMVVDTLGELVSFYAIATVAVVCGSFYPGVNGHNPLEPAALGIPTVFGPYMRNFVDPARELVNFGGARQVDAAESVPGVLRELLSSPSQRSAMAERAVKAIQSNQGAIERTLRHLEPLLAPKELPSEDVNRHGRHL